MRRFSFGDAFMHFTRTGGEGRFALPFMLTSFLMLGLIALISIWLNAPIYGLYGELIASGASGSDPDMLAFTEQMNAMNTRSLLSMAVTLPLYIGFWAMLESAVYRRYMRGDRFSLRMGPDEFRLMVVGLLWVAFFIVMYIGVIVALIPAILIAALFGQASPVLAGVMMAISVIVVTLMAGWFAARLAPASALTIRDEEIRAFDGWKATRGKGRTLLGVWLSWFVVQMILMGIILGIGAMFAFASVYNLAAGGDDSGAEILNMVSQPTFWGPFVVLQLLFVLIQSAFHYIWAGPAALAAKTDPTWSGRAGVQEEFS